LLHKLLDKISLHPLDLRNLTINS